MDKGNICSFKVDKSSFKFDRKLIYIPEVSDTMYPSILLTDVLLSGSPSVKTKMGDLDIKMSDYNPLENVEDR